MTSVDQQVEAYRYHHGIKPWWWDLAVVFGSRVSWDLLSWIAETDRLVDDLVEVVQKTSDSLDVILAIVREGHDDDTEASE